MLELEGKKSSIHRIGILQVHLVESENFVFTISNDQQLKAFDAGFNNEFYTLKNPNKCCYTSVFWDESVLFIADELGYVGVLNVYMDKPFVWKRVADRKIIRIEVCKDT